MRPLHWIWLLPAGFLAGCGDTQAGTSTQTENHLGMRLLVIDSILPSTNPDPGKATVSTLRFDASNFDFSQADSSGRSLSFERLDGAPIPFRIVLWDPNASLGRIQLRLDSTLRRSHASVVLRWNRPLLARSDSLSVWKGFTTQDVLLLNSVLVDDFESGTDTTLLPTHPRWTVTRTDSPSVPLLQFPDASGGRTGRALSFDYQLTDSFCIVLKSPLVADGRARVIRALDSLVFYVRGTGASGSNFFTAFENGDNRKAWKLDTLDTSWKRIRIRPSDFIPASSSAGGNVGWESIRDSATDLSFILTSTKGRSFWIDDVRLYGVVPDDLR